MPGFRGGFPRRARILLAVEMQPQRQGSEEPAVAEALPFATSLRVASAARRVQRNASCVARARPARNPGARAGAAVAIHRVAEDGEHLFRMRRGLRLQREAARLDDAHHFSSRSCLAVFRSRMTHWASASNLA